MADEFDPLKQTMDKPVEQLYPTIQKNTENKEDDLLRPQFENIFKTEFNQTNTSTEQKSQENVHQKLNHTQNASKIPAQLTNPFEEDVKKSSRPIHATEQFSQEQTRTAVSEQQKQLHCQDGQGYYNQDYDTTEAEGSYYDEYYEDVSLYKKKGLSGKMDRLIQRFPVLSLFYKPTTLDPSQAYESKDEHEYTEQLVENDKEPELVDGNQLPYELEPDDLALHERYSNKLRTQIIDLPMKDQRQPIDVCIHHDTYTLYSCDVGRSIVEIFDMYGKLQHTINDSTISKFQPTAIAVAYDGTIILSSHFRHCLYMYSPDDLQVPEYASQNEILHDGYHFKQYKLGTPGHEIHQFHHPAGIAIDFTDGYLYVCDRGNFRIQVMRPEGVCERIIDLLAYHEEEEYQIAPMQIAHQTNTEQIVCIVDQGDAICFVPKHADGPTYVEPFYITDNNGLGIQGASGIAVDSNDRIFISDTCHHRIIICTPEGDYITHFGVEGTGPGGLKRPCGLDVTMDGTVVVADSGNKLLQLFGSVREQTIDENQASTKESHNKNSS
ncbi:unnamed protein product [Rotaria sordida]|uniref:Uncharacterized protein n=2 Tax=Rotaria sordida TaxID=392033 RepID=A0A814DEX1_9BILA|nr:unnamed protein product [Rotaria sordida]